MDVLKRILVGVDYHVFCAKDHSYDMQIMSIYGMSEKSEDGKTKHIIIGNDGNKNHIVFQVH